LPFPVTRVSPDGRAQRLRWGDVIRPAGIKME
jgi:hypothetical protein